MPSRNRRDVIDESEVGAYHCYTRCVRGAFLIGNDPERGLDFDHRKVWIDERVEALASVFAIDVCDHTVLDNHLHLILRNRPDIAKKWSDEEVARRWLRLNISELQLNDPPSRRRLKALVSDKERIATLRERLSSVSWFFSYLKTPIAKLANEHDGVPGHFWGARFGAVKLKNEAALLACSLYVNLNPFRAGVAERVEDARFTSACDRLEDKRARDRKKTRSGWLAPVHVDGDGYDGVSAGRRASNKGFLGLSLEDYLELLDAVARRDRLERSGGVLQAARDTARDTRTASDAARRQPRR